MSTVMYNYRLQKSELWPTLTAIREYYLENWPYLHGFRNAVSQLQGPSGAMEALRQVEEDLKDQSHLVDLQLFEEGEHYIVRPLEKGHFFLNNYERWPDLVPIFLDTRTDDPDESTLHERRRIAEWTNKQIKLRHYLIYQLISKADYADAAYWSIRRMVG